MAVALLSAPPASGFRISAQHPEVMDNHKCKVVCQRFGMRSLGKAFQDIHHPTECVTKCDEVYPASMLQAVAKPPSAPHPAAPKPSKQARPQATTPVKRW